MFKSYFCLKYDVHSSTDGPRCHTQPWSALPRKGCTFIMQSLGEKRALSKDPWKKSPFFKESILHSSTSILQPMVQGVIRSLEAHYRGRVVRLLCRVLEKKEPCPCQWRYWLIRERSKPKKPSSTVSGRPESPLLVNRLPLLIQTIRLKIFKKA